MGEVPVEPWRADLHHCLVGLIKVALAEDAPDAASWRVSLVEAQARLPLAAPAAIPRSRLDSLWSLAVREAERDPAVRRDETVNPMLPAMCPLAASDLLSAAFESERLVERIRATASFG